MVTHMVLSIGENRLLPLPKKVMIDFIFSRIAEDGNEISEGELRKAMLEISDRHGG